MPYDSFNLGAHVGDDQCSVDNNRTLIKEFLPERANIQWLDQVHGASVVRVESHSNEPITADAAITNQNDIALAVMTADCLPILLSNSEGTEVAAIHGGWRPLAAGIIENTVNEMKQTDELFAWLGPCIGKSVFEVGSEVRSAFVNISDELAAVFTQIENGKYKADLRAIAKWQLSQLGVSTIEASQECTFSDSEEFYSYRKESVTGRMATFICIEKE